MGKRTSFDQILETEFRWPKVGDLPFLVGENDLHNAAMEHEVPVRLHAMVEGYKLGADCMVQQAMADQFNRDTLVYPIVFNYRQFLELSLKQQLFQFGDHVGIEANWNTHDLAPLWRSFEDMLTRYGTPDPDGADEVIAIVVAEFAKIDPNSYSYRYPVDRSGNALPLSIEQLDLAQLRDVMNAAAGYFIGCDGFLSEMRNTGYSASC